MLPAHLRSSQCRVQFENQEQPHLLPPRMLPLNESFQEGPAGPSKLQTGRAGHAQPSSPTFFSGAVNGVCGHFQVPFSSGLRTRRGHFPRVSLR